MSANTIRCPICGLSIAVVPDAQGARLIYDINDWQARCLNPQPRSLPQPTKSHWPKRAR
jgi:hypothetical protein